MVVEVFNLILKMATTIFTAAFRLVWPVPEKSIHGEIALVTGAGHGMGRLFALKLASLGAKVILVDVNETLNMETVALLRDAGANPYYYTCDLSKKHEIKKLARNIKEDVDFVSILVNNAGVIFVGDILSIKDEQIQATFDVNILSHFWLIKEFLPEMIQRNYGHIVALSSIVGRSGSPLGIDYSASKHAVIGLMDGLRRELRWLGKTGVKTTYACPSFVNTGFVKKKLIYSKAMPLLEPEYVVKRIVHAMLTDQPFVDIPSNKLTNIFKSILPDAAWEMVVDNFTAKIVYNGQIYPKS